MSRENKLFRLVWRIDVMAFVRWIGLESETCLRSCLGKAYGGRGGGGLGGWGLWLGRGGGGIWDSEPCGFKWTTGPLYPEGW